MTIKVCDSLSFTDTVQFAGAPDVTYQVTVTRNSAGTSIGLMQDRIFVNGLSESDFLRLSACVANLLKLASESTLAEVPGCDYERT